MKKFVLRLFLVESAVIFLIFSSVLLKADDIKIRIENGIEVIYNPEKPVPPKGSAAKIVLRQEFSIGVGRFDEDRFGELTSMDVDSDGNIYILDGKEKRIKVFDSAGKIINKFGKEGQGPGELNLPVSLQITPAREIVIGDASNQKLMFFSLEGKFLREMSTATKARGLVLPLFDSQGNIIGQQIVQAEGKIIREVRKYDHELNSLFTMASVDITGVIQGKIDPFRMVFSYQFGKDNIIYCSDLDKYEIEIFSPEGKLIKRILKDYVPVKLREKDKEEFFGRMPEIDPQAKGRIKFSEYFPAYQNFTMDEQWRLFVRTFEKGKNKGEYYLDVFDEEGKYIAKFSFKGEPRAWRGNKLYAMEEDESGFQTLKIYSVCWE
ncbi:MAG: 6-bladed beta-propeller [Acidobacteriota bacterium]|nr:6-bladed beta-propeller [Acidobacteriota bacterium]